MIVSDRQLGAAKAFAKDPSKLGEGTLDTCRDA